MQEDFQLNEKVVSNYWQGKSDAAGFLTYLLGRETWTLDHDPRIEGELSVWASKLYRSTDDFLSTEEGLGSLLTILGFVGSDKAFFLLNNLATRFPTLLNQLTAFSGSRLEDEQYGRMALIFLDRLRVANQHSAISLALGVDRLALVQYAIKQTIEKHGFL